MSMGDTIPIPKLPGCSFEDPRQHMSRKHSPKPPSHASTGPKDASAPLLHTGPALETLPAWVAYDRKVLRFYSYFKEAVVDSPEENHRIRKCIIYFYLEDESVHVAEPKQQNSGIPQGVFLKRHRIPKDGAFFTAMDLNVGMEVSFYARTFLITGCDPFTRTFLGNSGVHVPDDFTAPAEPIIAYRAHAHKSMPKTAAGNDLRKYVEAKLGKATSSHDLKKFIQNDRKVLRFFCLWDDRDSLYGDRRPYVLHYFLADDTVEVLEVNEPNNGRDPFPVFCRRGPMPNKPIEVDALGPTKTYSYYCMEDFMVGRTVNIYGRDMFIHDCDEFTKRYLSQVCGVPMDYLTGVEVGEAMVPLPQMQLPPHNGFGSTADSAQNCISLIPKPAKRDLYKLMLNEKKILRYTARLIETPGKTLTNADMDRRFVVQCFLADDTVSIFEPPTRNSGIIGGKFLERMEVRKECGTRNYLPHDFFVGAKLMIYCRCFALVEADDYTYGYMEDHCPHWPFSDYNLVLKKLKCQAEGKDEHLRNAFIERDADGCGLLDPAELQQALYTAGVEVNAQEVISVVRKLDDVGDGKVSIEKLFHEAFGLQIC